MAESFYYLGVYLQRRGDLQTAAAKFEKATELNPAYREAFLALGAALRKLGRESEAQRAFLQVQKLQRTAAEEQAAKEAFHSGTNLWNQGNLEEAIATFRQASNLDPTLGESHYNLGVLLTEKDKLKDAEAEFLEAIRLLPNYAPAYYDLDVVQMQIGKTDDAPRSFEKARQLDPTVRAEKGNAN